MGLVTRRSEQLDRLFDQFAIDPKKKLPKDQPKGKKKDEQDKDKKDQLLLKIPLTFDKSSASGIFYHCSPTSAAIIYFLNPAG